MSSNKARASEMASHTFVVREVFSDATTTLEKIFTSREQHGRPCTRWEVARVRRLGRQVSYVIVAAPLK